MLETVIAMAVLLLAFFGMLQIYFWAVTRLFCEYSAFYASKGVSLGYKYNLVLRSARVAAAGISGPARNSSRPSRNSDEYELLQSYMTKGDASGVWYKYWAGNTDAEPILRVSGPLPDDEAVSTVRLKNAPLLSPNFAKLLSIAENPEPAATVRTYNYSKLFLE